MADLACSVCGDADWFACRPGREAEAQRQGNLFVLAPEPAIPAQCWCLNHWPWRRAVAAA